ncbi:MAG: hypothetical protein ACOY81_04505 [Bacillota bacterium]
MRDLLPLYQQRQKMLQDYLCRPRPGLTETTPAAMLASLNRKQQLLQEYHRQMNTNAAPESVTASIPVCKK